MFLMLFIVVSFFLLVIIVYLKRARLFSVVAEKSEIPAGRQFRGWPEKWDQHGTTSVQTFGWPVLGQQKPEQRDRVSGVC